MQEAMNELAPGNHIVMTPSKDGSGQGAAIVAAVASRLRDAGSTSDHNHKMQLDTNNKS